jgi:hypothetical protein
LGLEAEVQEGLEHVAGAEQKAQQWEERAGRGDQALQLAGAEIKRLVQDHAQREVSVLSIA